MVDGHPSAQVKGSDIAIRIPGSPEGPGAVAPINGPVGPFVQGDAEGVNAQTIRLPFPVMAGMSRA